eukprot:scaffold270018_cov23-Prasinocladus_malaysianus.AAC.1
MSPTNRSDSSGYSHYDAIHLIGVPFLLTSRRLILSFQIDIGRFCQHGKRMQTSMGCCEAAAVRMTSKYARIIER